MTGGRWQQVERLYLEAAANPPAAWPGHRIGPYEIVSLAGSGGMGEVYKAKDTRLKRTVAIKVLPAFLAPDPERRGLSYGKPARPLP